MKIASSAALSLSCIFSPTSPQEVSQAVKIFTDSQCKFDVRGGGHSTVPGAANTNDDILIVAEGQNEHILTNENSRVLNGRPRTGSDWLDQVQVESSLIVEIRLTDQS